MVKKDIRERTNMPYCSDQLYILRFSSTKTESGHGDSYLNEYQNKVWVLHFCRIDVSHDTGISESFSFGILKIKFGSPFFVR